MNKPTQEQIKEFWEWYGFKEICGTGGTWRYKDYAETNYWWEDPNGKKYKDLPPIDLNNLFKYAVPSLQDKGITVELTAFEHKGVRCVCQDIVHNDIVLACIRNDDPALALFWALWQVKESR